jgi:hypothetical protein
MEESSAVPVSRSVGAAPPGQRSLWSHSPVLRSPGGEFMGRVFVEAWDDGTARLVATDRSLIAPAVTALNDTTPIRESAVDLAASPVTGTLDGGAQFIGRVIVEFWRNGVVVAVIGSNEQLLLQYADKRLHQSLAAL